LKLVIGTIQEKLPRGALYATQVRDSNSMENKIAYPFVRFLKIDPVNGFKAARHGFLRITQTSQNPVCDTKTGEYAIIRDIKALGS
jgi:hypothetical protein